jgi:hypothetical protein
MEAIFKKGRGRDQGFSLKGAKPWLIMIDGFTFCCVGVLLSHIYLG